MKLFGFSGVSWVAGKVKCFPLVTLKSNLWSCRRKESPRGRCGALNSLYVGCVSTMNPFFFWHILKLASCSLYVLLSSSVMLSTVTTAKTIALKRMLNMKFSLFKFIFRDMHNWYLNEYKNLKYSLLYFLLVTNMRNTALKELFSILAEAADIWNWRLRWQQ